MTVTAGTNLVALARRREEVGELLQERYAEGVIDVDEYEQRVERSHHAGTLGELDALVADLVIFDPLLTAAPAPTTAIAARPEAQVVRALFGNIERRGSWLVPRRLELRPLFSSIELDLRDAELEAGTTEIFLKAWLSNVEIIVSPGVRVSMEAEAVFATFEAPDPEQSTTDSSAPLVVIRGSVTLSNVEVRVRRPGESAIGAWWRRRRGPSRP